MVLTNEQVDRFGREGFLILRGVVKASRCDAIREIAMVHLRHKIPPVESEQEYENKDKTQRERISGSIAVDDGVVLRRLRQVYDRDIVFREWMEDTLLRKPLRQLLGDVPVLVLAHHNSVMTKMPLRSTQTKWHQDFRYWHYDSDNLISVWLALQDENAQNGVLEFIPGSHNMAFKPEQFDEKEYFREDLAQNQALISQKVSFELQKGDVVLFHCRLLHRANANATQTPKLSLVYTVKAEGVRAKKGSRSARFREIALP